MLISIWQRVDCEPARYLDADRHRKSQYLRRVQNSRSLFDAELQLKAHGLGQQELERVFRVRGSREFLSVTRALKILSALNLPPG
jgi:hypothetical protein